MTMTPMQRAEEAVAVAIEAHCPSCGVQLPGDPKDIARAVLQAIREPSGQMIMTGIAERHEQPVPEAWSLATENIWRAMIDAALSE
jgi:hypothetical protein